MAGQHQREDDASHNTSRGNSYLDFMFGMDKYMDEYEYEYKAPPVGLNSHLTDNDFFP